MFSIVYVRDFALMVNVIFDAGMFAACV